MKIFNWVHSRFNNKAENVKKSGDIAAAVDEQFPAESKCSDVFERWGGEILAIGTFGYDPLKVENEQVDGFVFEDNDDDNEDSSVKDKLDEEDEEQNPLVLDSYNMYNAEEAEMEDNWKHEDDHDQLQFGFEYVMMKKKERTTLADLFNADSDHDNHNDTTTNKQTLTKPDLLKQKFNRKSFGNKLNAKDVRPIHKFNQLMRRMLKRKIHPDAGPTNSKVAVVNNNNNNIKCRTSDDYASLLPTQDAII